MRTNVTCYYAPNTFNTKYILFRAAHYFLNGYHVLLLYILNLQKLKKPWFSPATLIAIVVAGGTMAVPILLF